MQQIAKAHFQEITKGPACDHIIKCEDHGAAEHAKNNLPDILTRWGQRATSERDNARTAQSFTVPKAELSDNGYDLSLNRYKEIVYEQVEYDPPAKIIADLRELEKEIAEGLDALEGMLK